MKTLLAGLACSALLLSGAVLAQPGQTANDNTSSHGSAVNPTPPANGSVPADANGSAKSSGMSHSAALRAKCRKQADEQNLAGKARTDYLHSCRSESAPQ